MDELRNFAEDRLAFRDAPTVGLRNKARCEVHGKLQMSALKDTKEWAELWDEIKSKLVLEFIKETLVQKLCKVIRASLLLSYILCVGSTMMVLSIPFFLMNGPLMRKSNLWRRLGLLDGFNRWFARSWLLASGTELEVSGCSVERFLSIVLYNHSSNTDPLVVQGGNAARVMSLFIGKKVLFCVPIIGQFWWSQGHVAIDRGKRDAAIGAMNTLGSLGSKRNVPICIAPEGSRSRDGHLIEFKKGAFHLQKDLECPFCPVFVAGGYENWPPKNWFSCMSRVSVHYAPPVTIDNSNETTDETRQRIEKLYHEMRHTAYTSTTCEPVSWRFFLRHLSFYPQVYVMCLIQAWLWRKATGW